MRCASPMFKQINHAKQSVTTHQYVSVSHSTGRQTYKIRSSKQITIKINSYNQKYTFSSIFSAFSPPATRFAPAFLFVLQVPIPSPTQISTTNASSTFSIHICMIVCSGMVQYSNMLHLLNSEQYSYILRP